MCLEYMQLGKNLLMSSSLSNHYIFQLGALDLTPGKILETLYDTNAEIEALVSAQPPTRMSRADRLKVTKGYVNYVRGLYRRWFNGVHVHVDVVSMLAKFLTRTFPSLCDLNSTQDKPTYVSTICILERFVVLCHMLPLLQ